MWTLADPDRSPSGRNQGGVLVVGWCRGWSGHGRHLLVSAQVRAGPTGLGETAVELRRNPGSTKRAAQTCSLPPEGTPVQTFPPHPPHTDEEHPGRCRTYEPADGEVRRTRPAIWPTSTTSVARERTSVKHSAGFRRSPRPRRRAGRQGRVGHRQPIDRDGPPSVLSGRALMSVVATQVYCRVAGFPRRSRA